MAAYKLTTGNTILRASDGASIPTDPGNRDYQAYLAWVALGNTADPADPAPLRYSEDSPLVGRVRTTDATPTEVYRATLAPTTGYRALLTLLGVDAGNGVLRQIYASVVAKRLGGGALLVGAPVIIANHLDTGAAATTSGVAAWAIAATVSGNDFVVTVTGALGRTIDWSLSGRVDAFTPGGRP